MVEFEELAKLYNNAKNCNLFLEDSDTIKDVLNKCKGNKDLSIFKKEINIGVAKVILDGKNYIRLVFEIEDQNNGRGKVQNIERVVQTIRLLEKVLVFMYDCKYEKNNKYSYIDILKLVN